eukprot:CAMPEP_0201729054 /NCGR_PEP_ID=MMETSP0593-20130828/17882_1 /ASSEMBLY_ACC=CAM_ASM_000672 /TAXON_ID=267983 /ORGANISM="Skeletonema japonicum, Strain CCMP2506" /LENGTH=303 /DNA_ID=CAMNT_0048221325 /DNA_START=83 /DNA_END=994 /DNA_ORIENTATION=+
MQLFTTAAFAAALMSGVSGFSVQQLHASRAAKSQLKMSSESSRRDILSNAASAAAIGISALVIDTNTASAASLRTGSVTEQSAANKAAESYQGVYSDPNHPEGYRVIMASGKGATMTLSDGESGDETYKNIPVGVNGNELSLDFGFKGGPKGVIAVLSDDKQSITFPDGNTWTKNKNKYDGIYKDPKYPNGYRVVRKFRGETKIINFIAEVNDTGNEKDSVLVKGSHASLFSIPTAAFTFYDLPGTVKPEESKPTNVVSFALQRQPDYSNGVPTIGQFSLEESNSVFPYGTITFPDKTVWTRI